MDSVEPSTRRREMDSNSTGGESESERKSELTEFESDLIRMAEELGDRSKTPGFKSELMRLAAAHKVSYNYSRMPPEVAEKKKKEHLDALQYLAIKTVSAKARRVVLARGQPRKKDKGKTTRAMKPAVGLQWAKNKNTKNKTTQDEEAGKAQASVAESRKEPEELVTQAGKAEAFVTEARKKPEELVTQAGKAEASVTESRKKPEELVTQAGKAQVSVTEPVESVTEASNAAAKTSDASNVLQELTVFEDAQDFGAEFQSFWDKHFGHRCAYDENTTIPAMHYTHDSGANARETDTLQVISVKVASVEEGLRWPLQVFGMVSVRDVLDRKRNIIFHRERDNCQTIYEKDPYLTLAGPSRAVVVCTDPSYIEVVLKLKGDTESEDKELSRLAVVYRLSCFINGLYPSELSTLELLFSEVYNSVEATIHLKVTGGSWPDGCKGVFSATGSENVEVKLLDVGDDGLPVDVADSMIKLSRRVVSVELRGKLEVFVSACSAAGDEERCEASFVPAKAGISPGFELKVGSCCMEATVAWSLFRRT